MRARAEVVVVGGGIAGLAVVYHLARSGLRDVVLVEREPLLAAHASGRNAAIYRPLAPDPAVGALTARSRALLDALLDDPSAPWLQTTGLLLVAANVQRVEAEANLARESALPHRVLQGKELPNLAAPLAGGVAKAGLLVPAAGVVDIHRITTALASAARAAGAEILTRTEVTRVRIRAGRAEGIELSDGFLASRRAVVLAAGAWSAALGAASACPLPLIPRRRHLMQLVAPLAPTTPVVWCLDEEVYFRPESGGVLSSPCDAAPWPPGTPPVDDEVLAEGARKLERIAPSLAGARLRRAWACLRTAAPGGGFVAGPDPRAHGLFWIAGLGGHGMGVGVALGELVGELVRGAEPLLAKQFAPGRLLSGSSPTAPADLP